MPALRNILHEKFVQAVASGKYSSATAAYQSVRPDASLPTARVKACVIMKRPEVKARLQEVTNHKVAIDQRIVEKTVEKVAERLSDKIVGTREWVIDRLVENANRAMQATQAKDANGAPVGEFKYDGNVANRALELLGKEVGMFIERTENRNVIYGISDEPTSPEEWTAKYASPEKSKLN
jgi:hypothetical protein